MVKKGTKCMKLDYHVIRKVYHMLEQNPETEAKGKEKDIIEWRYTERRVSRDRQRYIYSLCKRINNGEDLKGKVNEQDLKAANFRINNIKRTLAKRKLVSDRANEMGITKPGSKKYYRLSGKRCGQVNKLNKAILSKFHGSSKQNANNHKVQAPLSNFYICNNAFKGGVRNKVLEKVMLVKPVSEEKQSYVNLDEMLREFKDGKFTVLWNTNKVLWNLDREDVNETEAKPHWARCTVILDKKEDTAYLFYDDLKGGEIPDYIKHEFHKVFRHKLIYVQEIPPASCSDEKPSIQSSVLNAIEFNRQGNDELIQRAKKVVQGLGQNLSAEKHRKEFESELLAGGSNKSERRKLKLTRKRKRESHQDEIQEKRIVDKGKRPVDEGSIDEMGSVIEQRPKNLLYEMPFYEDIKVVKAIEVTQKEKQFMEDEDGILETMVKLMDTSKHSFEFCISSGLTAYSNELIQASLYSSDGSLIGYHSLPSALDMFKGNHNKFPNDKFTAIININNNHWVSCTIIPDSKDKNKAYAIYRDSFGEEIPEWIKEEIKKVYSNVEIMCNEKRLQKDGHSCGPFAILGAFGDSIIDNKEIEKIFYTHKFNSRRMQAINKKVRDLENEVQKEHELMHTPKSYQASTSIVPPTIRTKASIPLQKSTSEVLPHTGASIDFTLIQKSASSSGDVNKILDSSIVEFKKACFNYIIAPVKILDQERDMFIKAENEFVQVIESCVDKLCDNKSWGGFRDRMLSNLKIDATKIDEYMKVSQYKEKYKPESDPTDDQIKRRINDGRIDTNCFMILKIEDIFKNLANNKTISEKLEQCNFFRELNDCKNKILGYHKKRYEEQCGKKPEEVIRRTYCSLLEEYKSTHSTIGQITQPQGRTQDPKVLSRSAKFG